MIKLSWNPRSLTAVVALAIASPALAQSGSDARLKKIEAEVSALQRAVFPGGDPRFFPQAQPATAPAGAIAANPNVDMLTRMDSLESQIARLTEQVEQDHNKLEKLNARIAALEGTSGGETTAPSTAGPGAATPAPGAGSAAVVKPPVTPAPKPVAGPGITAPPPAATKPAVTTPAKPAESPAKRLAAIRAIEKPKTKDPGDDEYSYGFRLWDAKFYPEAEQQLKLFMQKYPRHPRTSYARNLIGRSYLDDGSPREAAGWFLQNYKTEPRGDRAADSLLLLAESMRQLGDTKRGCVALRQFTADFASESTGRLKTQYDLTRAGLKCD